MELACALGTCVPSDILGDMGILHKHCHLEKSLVGPNAIEIDVINEKPDPNMFIFIQKLMKNSKLDLQYMIVK